MTSPTTPGIVPHRTWHVGPCNEHIPLTPEQARLLPCYGVRDENGDRPPETEENLALHAAAPDLLLAAESLINGPWWRYEGAHKVCALCGCGAAPSMPVSSIEHGKRCPYPIAVAAVAKAKVAP